MRCSLSDFPLIWEKALKKLRVFGNVGVVIGQISLLFYSKPVGLCILIMCGLMNLPYFWNHRYYDVVLIIVIGILVNVCGLIFK